LMTFWSSRTGSRVINSCWSFGALLSAVQSINHEKHLTIGSNNSQCSQCLTVPGYLSYYTVLTQWVSWYKKRRGNPKTSTTHCCRIVFFKR
jgi:hypothetical protein